MACWSAALRNGNVHSRLADVLDPVIARYAGRDLGGRFFRADAAYAIPAIYMRLEEARFFYAIRLPANAVLREKIAHRLTRPVGRPSLTRSNGSSRTSVAGGVLGQAAPRHRQDRMASGRAVPQSRLHRHQPADGARLGVRFYNQRGTAEQHIKEGKYAFRWTRLSCRKFRHNEVRLQLHALAYNLATFLRCIELPEAMADWSLTACNSTDQDRRRVVRAAPLPSSWRGRRHRPDGAGRRRIRRLERLRRA
ncbi:MAG: transposase [Paracoccaceae bacterium]